MKLKPRSKVTRSKEFIEGYFACKKGISRPRNAYVQFYLPEKTYVGGPDIETLAKAHDWFNGWSQCFWGFGVNEVDP